MKELIEKIANWQDEHIASFADNDEDVRNAFSLKKEHIDYVRRNAKELAEHLKLSEHLIDLAELIGLCHDLGRFTQYDKYKTFNDSVSVDHALLAVKIFDTCPYKKELPWADLFLMQFAIMNHNKKKIEEIVDMDGEDVQKSDAIILAKIIRDADKLDIYRVLNPYLTGDNAKGAPTFVNADASKDASDKFIELFVEGRQADYREIKTHGDRKLVRLLWVYDINYAWTIKKLDVTGYIDNIVESLYPKNERMNLGIKRLREYMAEKIAKGDNS